MTVKVGVNGYGVIGRRVADAVAVQDDMELVGVADVVSDWRTQLAIRKDIELFAATGEAMDSMRARGLDPRGGLRDLLDAVDVVVDCTPKGIDAQNRARYEDVGVRAIFQGGAKHELAGHSFVASANYETALGRQATRVVSCNTTSTVRRWSALHPAHR